MEHRFEAVEADFTGAHLLHLAAAAQHRRVRSRDRLCRAVLVHPVSADTPADVLPWRDGPSAAFASATGGVGTDCVQHRERCFRPAERCRAEGRYRQPETPGAEIVQVRRADSCADMYGWLSAHVSLNQRSIAELKRAQRQPADPAITGTW
jgi:hypothetical protein